jgi:hypothetical protein
LGITPHSGWAAAVLLAGTPQEPRVILRERLELSEARLAGSKQPYHALEGLPLAQACQALGLRVARIPQRELPARAAAALRESPQRLAATLKALGRGMGPPWGADQKDATLLAWLLLAEVALFRRE